MDLVSEMRYEISSDSAATINNEQKAFFSYYNEIEIFFLITIYHLLLWRVVELSLKFLFLSTVVVLLWLKIL